MRIYTANKALVYTYQCRFRRSNGSEAAAADVAEKLFALIDQKRLSVEVVYRAKDDVAETLALRAKAAAQEKKLNRENDAA